MSSTIEQQPIEYNSEKAEKNDFEKNYSEILNQTGGLGLFQLYVISMVLCGANATTFMYNSLSYLELAPKYLCQNVNDTTWYSCEPDIFCNQPNVIWQVDYSCDSCLHNWVEKLDLTCAPKWKVGLLGSSLWMGWVFSLLFLPQIADLFGRRWVYTICMWLLVPVLLTTLFNHSLDLMITCIFFQGVLSSARVSIGFVYMMEFVPKERQTLVCTIFSMQMPIISLLATGYFAFISKNWFWFVFIGFILLLINVVCTLWLPESPKYLLKHGRKQEAIQVLRRVARINGQKEQFEDFVETDLITKLSSSQELNIGNSTLLLDDTVKSAENIDQEIKQEHLLSEQSQPIPNIYVYLKEKEVLVNLIVMSIIWLSSSFNNYLVLFQLKYFPGNIFVNTTASCCSDLLAYTTGGLIFTCAGLKTTLNISFLIAICGGLAIVLLTSGGRDGGSHAWNFPLCVLIAKFGISSAYNICYLSNSFLFPAQIAATTLGICNTFARTATILAPMLAEFKQPLPMIIFTILSAVSWTSSLFIMKPVLS